VDNRFEFRLTVPASDPDRALHALIETLKKILAKIWEAADLHVRILPWFRNSSANPLKSIADIPTSVSLLHQFFPHVIPISKGGTRFTSVYIRSSISPSTLKENVDWYLYDSKHHLYLAQIQSKIVDTILWLFWLSELTNTGTLCHAIEAMLQACPSKSIQVSLHWRMIQLDHAGWIPEDEAVHEIRIKVDRDHRNEAKLALQEIYSSEATEWPLHLCMRALPLLKDILNGLIKKIFIGSLGVRHPSMMRNLVNAISTPGK
jgi:hypothetical protein